MILFKNISKMSWNWGGSELLKPSWIRVWGIGKHHNVKSGSSNYRFQNNYSLKNLRDSFNNIIFNKMISMICTKGSSAQLFWCFAIYYILTDWVDNQLFRLTKNINILHGVNGQLLLWDNIYFCVSTNLFLFCFYRGIFFISFGF